MGTQHKGASAPESRVDYHAGDEIANKMTGEGGRCWRRHKLPDRQAACETMYQTRGFWLRKPLRTYAIFAQKHGADNLCDMPTAKAYFA